MIKSRPRATFRQNNLYEKVSNGSGVAIMTERNYGNDDVYNYHMKNKVLLGILCDCR